MNERFVNVKVDREERPDIDALYMEAVQAMTGHGGWPLNVFLTPEQVPFYGGTYFPPEPRHGMPSFPQVLEAVARAWTDRREEIREQGGRMAGRLSGGALLRPSDEPLRAEALDEAVTALQGQFDSVQGGFGGAPKFPPHATLEFLLRRAAGRDRPAGPEAQMALFTLRSMAGGGIYDHVGGGFARYAVDATWTVPHFEKMLYDNALLARAYLHGFQLTGDPALRRTAEETLDWALRELRMPDGGFASALDADSEGVEGKFYVWTIDELRDALGDDPADADAAIAWLGATSQGNVPGEPGVNVLESRGPEPPAEQRERIRARLLEVRAQRVRPGLDDKRLASWNALMIAALAEAGAVLEREDLLAAARDTATFVLERMRTPEGRLLRTFNAGQARLNAYLEDHAFLLEALLDAVRGDVRGPLVRRGPRARRRPPGALRRPRARRLLLDLVRPRAAPDAPQGPRGRAHPQRRLGGRAGAPAAGRADRRASLRGGRARPAAPPARAGATAPDRLRPPPAGARLPPRADARGGAGGRRRRRGRARPRRPRASARPRRARRRRRRRTEHRPAARGPRPGGRPRRRVRVRALRLQAPGHHARRAACAARRRGDAAAGPLGVIPDGRSARHRPSCANRTVHRRPRRAS